MTNEYIDRVTFFSVNNLSSSHNLLNAEKILLIINMLFADRPHT
jgi:hypothetical protein